MKIKINDYKDNFSRFKRSLKEIFCCQMKIKTDTVFHKQLTHKIKY